MSEIIVNFSGKQPKYATQGSAGFDLTANSFDSLWKGTKEIDLKETMKHSLSKGYITLRPMERVVVNTGLFVEIPQGYEIQIRDKSGISKKKGLKVHNSPGTIDSDYIGEIKVILTNLTDGLNKISIGDEIAQGVVCKVEQAIFVNKPLENFTKTGRGSGGFGSTSKQ